MSYLHCPTCSCAYNVAREPACPRCGVRPGTPADPSDDVIAAVEQLARAIARATPGELAVAEATLDARLAQLALPASTARADAAPPELVRAVRSALAASLAASLDSDDAGEPAAAAPRGSDIAPRVRALLGRLAPASRAVLDAALQRLAPRLPASTAVPPTRVAATVRAARAWGTARLRGSLARARDAFARAA